MVVTPSQTLHPESGKQIYIDKVAITSILTKKFFFHN
jgi:hypothetical protein